MAATGARTEQRRTFFFEAQIRRESEALQRTTLRVPIDLEVVDPGHADEPWVAFTNQDHFGLALSGGGMRSATFGLGVLQALGERGVLDHLDYLSTVSGGGYIGGFWTAWRSHPRPGDARRFPAPAAGRGDAREPTEVRHLREFSRFLMPRMGFTQAETWAAVVAILGGTLPALSAAVALIGLFVYVWYGLNVVLLRLGAEWAAAGIGALSLVVHLLSEAGWRAKNRSGNADRGFWSYTPFALVAAAISAYAYFEIRRAHPATEYPGELGLPNVLLEPAAAWALAGLVLLVLRAVFSRFLRNMKRAIFWSSGFDRSVSRSLAPATGWLVVGALWEASRWLLEKTWNVPVAASGAVGFAGAFVWLRDWLEQPLTETRSSRLIERVARLAKPLAPQLLAKGAVVLLVITVMLSVQSSGLNPERVGPVIGVIGGVLVCTLLFFDPARVGLHDFYRMRICRCFLGAARATETTRSRSAGEHDGDDVLLGQLTPAAPLHLICCAANNLSGDVLGNLYRGARSATLSRFGISLGNYTAELDQLRLSSALTASAAAFNSQMGAMSVRIGPAVAFVMSALNLRLGLWVPHPLNPSREYHLLPGLYFFSELFGITRCDPLSSDLAAAVTSVGGKVSELPVPIRAELRRNLHLSDGGHFENLALYELVRRHCRYVIVCDASADPDVAFDDLANAARRIREDFGVEIEIDTEPLRPDASGRSKQHAVVGTIHYDGARGTDKGVLVYLKPTLTGDEPTDVLQYRARSLDFPHESTGDQFYDEAQWEAYRRLGEHAVHSVFRFLDHETPQRKNFVDRLFLSATQHWYPTPPGLKQVFLELTSRCAALEAEIRERAPEWLRAEFFPEIGAAMGVTPQPSGPPLALQHVADEQVRAAYLMMLVAQVMEDAWVDAELDTNWSHPLNEGWMNYFQRWASAPSFRRWWPILRPIYNPSFREFVKERFGIRLADPRARDEAPAASAYLELETLDDASALAGLPRAQWEQRHGPLATANMKALRYRLKLDGDLFSAFDVGFLLYQEQDRVVTWKVTDFYVPPALSGGGVTARFLDAILRHFADRDLGEAHVLLDASATEAPPSAPESRRRARPDAAARRVAASLISFYKSRGFAYVRQDDQETQRVLSKPFG